MTSPENRRAELERLARLLYARHDPAEHARLTAQYSALLRDIEADVPPAPEFDASVTAPVPHDPERDEDVPRGGSERRQPARVPRFRPLIIGIIIAAAIAGVWLGSSLTGATLAATPVPAVTTTITATAQPSPKPAPPALGIFSRKQVTSGALSDVPSDTRGSLAEYDRKSFRYLGPIDSSLESLVENTDGTKSAAAELYAARAGDNDCLLVLHNEKLVSSSCVTDDDFPVTGLTVSFVVDRERYSLNWVENGQIGGYSWGPI